MSKHSTADLADRHRINFALAVLAAGLIYLAKALESVVSAPIADVLDYVIIVLAISTIGVLIPPMLTKMRLPRNEKPVYFSEDGFSAQLIRQAFKTSWSMTFFGLVILEVIAQRLSLDLPAAFFLQIALFIMMAGMSISFIVLDRLAGTE